jgi:AraC-like DNA-binding protein
MEFKFETFPVIEPLTGFIEKIWLFESPGMLPADDLKLIVPNGRPLLLIPYRNGLAGKMGGKQYIAKENSIALIGISDNPSIVDSLTNSPTGSIGIEFSPSATYRFFHFSLKNIKGELVFLNDLPGARANCIEQRIADAESPSEKIRLIQSYLFSLFTKKKEDTLFEYCIQQIETSHGSMSIKQLEKLTGFSSRWLNLKFKENIGLSPKNLSSIVRFQHYYKAILSDTAQFRTSRPFYNHYYDGSHFIKDFKRFTGMPPSRLIESKNNFGKLFYGTDGR